MLIVADAVLPSGVEHIDDSAEEVVESESVALPKTPEVAEVLLRMFGNTHEAIEHMIAELGFANSIYWQRAQDHINTVVTTDKEGYDFIHAIAPFISGTHRHKLECLLMERIEPSCIAHLNIHDL